MGHSALCPLTFPYPHVTSKESSLPCCEKSRNLHTDRRFGTYDGRMELAKGRKEEAALSSSLSRFHVPSTSLSLSLSLFSLPLEGIEKVKWHSVSLVVSFACICFPKDMGMRAGSRCMHHVEAATVEHKRRRKLHPVPVGHTCSREFPFPDLDVGNMQ